MEVLGLEVPVWFLFAVLLCIVYKKQRKLFSTFDDQNIPGPTPLPILGNLIGLLRGVWTYDLEQYEKLGKPPVFRMFISGKPNLVIFDKELVKYVLVKDFCSFTNRKPEKSTMMPRPMHKMVNILRDEEWRNVRAHLSPTFSGSKMRRMLPLINDCGRAVVESLVTPARAGDEVDLHDLSKRYSLDAISRVAFGLDTNCHEKDNVVAKNANALLHVNFRNPLIWLMVAIPQTGWFFKKIGYELMNVDAVKFFLDVVEKAISERKESHESPCADFLQLMIEGNEEFQKLKSEDGSAHKGLTNDEILAQCLMFFIAGNSTVSTVMLFTLYHLALQPDLQEKAYQETLSVITQDGIAYEHHKKLRYLEMCIDESARLNSPVPRVDRECSRDVEVEGLRIPKGTIVNIPINAFHHDPDVWEDPEKFDPERFSPEAKELIAPYQYMPFGGGPRVCVAQRLAMLELKIGLAHILHTYKLVTTEKTEIPLKMQSFRREPKNGAWVKFEERH